MEEGVEVPDEDVVDVPEAEEEPEAEVVADAERESVRVEVGEEKADAVLVGEKAPPTERVAVAVRLFVFVEDADCPGAAVTVAVETVVPVACAVRVDMDVPDIIALGDPLADDDAEVDAEAEMDEMTVTVLELCAELEPMAVTSEDVVPEGVSVMTAVKLAVAVARIVDEDDVDAVTHVDIVGVLVADMDTPPVAELVAVSVDVTVAAPVATAEIEEVARAVTVAIVVRVSVGAPVTVPLPVED